MNNKRPFVIFDTEYLKSVIPIENVIEQYVGWDVSTRKNIKCPSPTHDEKTPSAKIYTNTNTCYCYGCGRVFDPLSIIKMYNPNLSFTEVCYLAAEQFGVPLESCSDYSQRQGGNKSQTPHFAEKFPLSASDLESLGFDSHEKKEYKKDAFEIADYVGRVKQNINETDYHRGLSQQTLDHFNIGFDPCWKNPLSQNDFGNNYPRLIIPTSDHSYQARLAVKLPDKEKEKRVKCRKVGNTELFNAEALNDDKPIFIVEGEIDAMSYYDVGCSAIAIGGVSNVSSLLKRFAEDKPIQPFIIAMDNDDSGNRAKMELIKGFDELRISYIVATVAHPYKDANEALMADRNQFAEMAKQSEIYASRFKTKEKLIPKNVKTVLNDIETQKPKPVKEQTSPSLKKEWVAGDTATKISIEDFLLERTDEMLKQYQVLHNESAKSYKELKSKYTKEEWKENFATYKEYNQKVQDNPGEFDYSLTPQMIERIKDTGSMEWLLKIGNMAKDRLNTFSNIRETIVSYQLARESFYQKNKNPNKAYFQKQ